MTLEAALRLLVSIKPQRQVLDNLKVVSTAKNKVQGLGVHSGFRGLGFRVRVEDIGCRGSGFRVWDLGVFFSISSE